MDGMRNCGVTRREALRRCGLGIGGLGLAGLLGETGALAEGGKGSPSVTHHAPRAKRIIHIFPEGGPSQVDSFDPKPMLEKYHAKPIKDILPEYLKNAPKTATDMGRLGGTVFRSGFKYKQYGQSGTWVSELFPELAKHVDDMCIVRSMSTKSNVHEPAQLLMNCGEATLFRPSMGAWTLYGLGAENRNLPAFVALLPGGMPASGERHWSNAFLPGSAAGTAIFTKDASVEKMIEHVRSRFATGEQQRKQLDLLYSMNRRFQARHAADDVLESRIATFETAFRMQTEAADAFDISREPASVREAYGDTPQGRQLLLARRLSERGVRYIQAWHTGWDSHDRNDEEQKKRADECDKPLAALLGDLKSRGMLKDTLVLWAGEFGRTPTADINDLATKKGVGRDHNSGGFTVWMAGGGVKGGLTYGSSDDFGALATEGKMDIHDLHATILHLLGFDHTRLTYRYAGRDFRLTDVHGEVVKGLFA